MDSSLLPSTKDSTRAPASSIPEEFLSEESLSEHSFVEEKKSHAVAHHYMTTNLIVSKNITLADVITEEVKKEEILKRISRYERGHVFEKNGYGRVDPRGEYKKLYGTKVLDTLVASSEIPALCEKAGDFLRDALAEKERARVSAGADVSTLLRRLMERVVHDHRQRPAIEESKTEELPSLRMKTPGRERLSSKSKLKESRKAKLEEALLLMNDHRLPLAAVQRRLKLTSHMLRKLKAHGVADPELFERRLCTGPKFGKLHERARAVIKETFEEAR